MISLSTVRGGAMIGTIVFPVLLVIFASAPSGGDGMGVAFFLITVVMVGLASAFAAAVLTVPIHVRSDGRTRLDNLELGCSVVAVTSFLLWWFILPDLLWFGGVSIGSLAVLHVVVVVRAARSLSP